MNLDPGSCRKCKMDAKNTFIRQTAYKVRIKDLFSGTYAKEEGEFGINYVLFKNKKISRVNIIANVIEKYENEDKSYGVIDFDDCFNLCLALLENIPESRLSRVVLYCYVHPFCEFDCAVLFCLCGMAGSQSIEGCRD